MPTVYHSVPAKEEATSGIERASLVTHNNGTINDSNKSTLWERLKCTHEGLGLAAWSCAAVFLVNLIFLCTAVGLGTSRLTIAKSSSANNLRTGISVFYEGNCDAVNRGSIAAHVLINALSAVLLAASNYTMQILCAPSRNDIDRAHKSGTWLDLGHQSLRNLPYKSTLTIFLWVFLGFSSAPIHLLYNAAVTKALQANGFRYADFHGPNDATSTGFIPNPGLLHNLTGPECKSIYGSNFVSQYSDVFIYANPLSTQAGRFPMYNVSSNGSVSNAAFQDAIVSAAYCLAKPAPEHCALVVSLPILGIVVVCSCLKAVAMFTTLLIQRSPTLITLGDAIESFVKEPDHTTRDRCLMTWREVQASQPSVIEELGSHARSFLAYIHDFLAFMHSLPFLHGFLDFLHGFYLAFIRGFLAFIHSLPFFHAFLACIHSFLTFMYLAIRDEYPGLECTREPSEHIQHSSPQTASAESKSHRVPHSSARTSTTETKSLRRWRYIPRKRIWFSTTSMWAAGLLAAFALLIKAQVMLSAPPASYGKPLSPGDLEQPPSLPQQAPFFSSVGLGEVDPRLLVPINFGEDVSGLSSAALLANCPQLIFSVLYLLYNTILTQMVSAHEYNKFSLAGPKKTLRVSRPSRGQRSSYYLQLPYRYALPLIVISAVLHWLISEGLFIVQIWQFDTSDKPNELSNIMIAVGFSPLAIVIAMVVFGTTFMAIVLVFGRRRLPGNMPIARGCSLLIAAACHPHPDDRDAAYLPLGWGEPVEIQNREGEGHCCFTSFDVLPPVEGRLYK